MAINQIKVATEAKQDTMIANNADILNLMTLKNSIKSKQRGFADSRNYEGNYIEDFSISPIPQGSELKVFDISPVNINKAILFVKSGQVEISTETQWYIKMPLQLKSDGIYTIPIVTSDGGMITGYTLKNLSWEVVEFY